MPVPVPQTHNYPNHGRPQRLGPTGGDSHSGSLYSEQGSLFNDASKLPYSNVTAFASFDTVPTNANKYVQRSSPMPYGQDYPRPPDRQDGTWHELPYHYYHPSDPIEDITQGVGKMSFGTSPAYDSPVSQPPLSQPPLDVRGSGRWQRRPYMTHSDYQQPEEMNHVHYSDRSNPSSRSTTQFPYARVPTAPSPVPPDVSPETSELTIKKKRKRADARQLEALNRMYARTAFPSTEERLQLAKDLDMSARGVQIWFQNKRQASRQGGRNPPANSSISQVAVPLPPDTPPVVMHPRGDSPPVSPMAEASYRSRSPMGAQMRSGQTPSPPSGRTRADIDPRTGRYWVR